MKKRRYGVGAGVSERVGTVSGGPFVTRDLQTRM